MLPVVYDSALGHFCVPVATDIADFYFFTFSLFYFCYTFRFTSDDAGGFNRMSLLLARKITGAVVGALSIVASTLIFFCLFFIVYPRYRCRCCLFGRRVSNSDIQQTLMRRKPLKPKTARNKQKEFFKTTGLLELFMLTCMCDVILCLNNAWWDDGTEGTVDKWVCKVRAAWFQVGLMGTIHLTTCTVYELYKVISRSETRYGQQRLIETGMESKQNRMRCYILSGVIMIMADICIVAILDGFGPVVPGINPQSLHHRDSLHEYDMCYIRNDISEFLDNTTLANGLKATAVSPSLIEWLLACLIGIQSVRKINSMLSAAKVARKRWMSHQRRWSHTEGQMIDEDNALSATEEESSNAMLNSNLADAQRAQTQQFVKFMQKMLLFPLTTFLVWIYPLLYIWLFIHNKQNFTVQITLQIFINCNGLKNAILLYATNSLVRQELSCWWRFFCCCRVFVDGTSVAVDRAKTGGETNASDSFDTRPDLSFYDDEGSILDVDDRETFYPVSPQLGGTDAIHVGDESAEYA